MRDKIYFHFLILFVIPFIVFFQSLFFGFVWVDHSQIEEGRCLIKNFQEFKAAFFQPILVERGQGNYYRPMLKISYTLDYLLFKYKSWGFHLTNIIIHIAVLFLLYSILLKLGLTRELALILSLFYGILPLNTSTVVWLGARADLLATFFTLLSFIFYLLQERKGCFLFFSLLSYFLALLSKEIAFPFFLIIAIHIVLRRRKKTIIFPYLSLALMYLLIRYISLGHMGTRIEILRGQPYVTVLSSLVGFSQYLFKFFLPWNLSVADAFPKYERLFSLPVMLAVIIFTTLVVFFIFSFYKKIFLPAVALGWIFSFYIPISNIVPALHFWAERFFYLPGIGVIILLGYVWKRRRYLGIIFILLLFYGGLTLHYQQYFCNDLKLFQRALKVSRFSKEPQAMLGYYYLTHGDYLRAIYYYCLSAQPEIHYFTYSPLPEVYNNLGVIFLRLGKYKQAQKWIQKALGLDREYKDARINLEILFQKQKNVSP